jgi:DNA-directed RNA polymerase specialized sigma24 family protein
LLQHLDHSSMRAPATTPQLLGTASASRREKAAARLANVDSADELEKAYREEATRIRAALAARLGDVGLAEEAVQDAFVEALEHWHAEGIPPNPGGWLATTARRKAIDLLRRERAGQERLALLAASQPSGPGFAGEPREPGPAGGG